MSRAAITDARALLATLLESDWQEAHVVSGDTEIFLARAGGCANPMRASAAPAPQGREVSVKAPHVATLVSTLAVGTPVAAGDTIATLSLLDEEIVLPAPAAGQVLSVAAAAGALVEFDQPILTLREVA